MDYQWDHKKRIGIDIRKRLGVELACRRQSLSLRPGSVLSSMPSKVGRERTQSARSLVDAVLVGAPVMPSAKVAGIVGNRAASAVYLAVK